MWLLLPNLDTYNSETGKQRENVCHLRQPQVNRKHLQGLLGSKPGAQARASAPVSEALWEWRQDGERQTHANGVHGVFVAPCIEQMPGVRFSIRCRLMADSGDSEEKSEAQGGGHLVPGHKGGCKAV